MSATVGESLTQFWEKTLVDYLTTREDATTEVLEDEPGVEEEEGMTFKDALQMAVKLKKFCLTKNMPTALMSVQTFTEDIEKESVHLRRKARQTTLDFLFII